MTRNRGIALSLLALLVGCAREPAAPQESTLDLALTSIRVSPSPATVGASVLVEANVLNAGEELVADATLTFYLGKSQTHSHGEIVSGPIALSVDEDRNEINAPVEIINEPVTIEVLTPGDSTLVATRVDSLASGDHLFLAQIDIEDDNPANDQAFRAVTAVGADEIRIHMIDVGQGDAILVEFPDGPKILIDGGEPDEGAGLLQYLRTTEVNALDLVVSTHQDQDHYGGLTTVLRGLPVTTLWRSCRRDGGGADLAELHSVVDSLVATGGLEVLNVADDEEWPIADPESRLIVLNPDATLTAECDADEDELNELSVVIRIEFDQFAALLTGDIGADTEAELIARDPLLLDATVVQAPHHGSRFSSSASFAQAVDAELVLISVGAENSHGHPHPETLQRWSDAGVEVRRTDEEGTLIVVSNGNGFRVIQGVGP